MNDGLFFTSTEMTNLEKIKARVKHPMFTNIDFVSALDDRGLVSTDQYDSIANKQALDLTEADLLCRIINLPSVSEGGFSVSVTEKDSLKKQASAIYSKYGETGPFTSVIQDASDQW